MAGQLQVGDWRVSPRLHSLERDGEVRRVSPKAMAILMALAGRAGEVVGKDELIAAVWTEQVVSDEALAAPLYELRRALDDDARQPRYIETIRKSGYRLVAHVSRANAPERATQASPRRRWLRWGWVAAGLVLVVGWSLRTPWFGAPAPPRSLAVLPLATFSVSGEDLLAAALTEMLTADLAQMCPAPVTPGIAIRSRADPWGLAEAVELLGVEAVVEGSVLRSGDQVWIAVQLVDTRSGAMLWSATYERQLVDELLVLREVALDAAGRIDEQLRSNPG